jgi:Leucine-rich repeat (LRR) protein
LANNNIRNVSARAFDGLLQLIVLNMTNNNISRIPNGGLHGLVALQSLDLSHNKIEKLDNKTHGLFDDCLSLERLNLSHNRISFITRKTFPSSPYVPYKLSDIDLSYNSMPVVTFDLVFGTSKVQKLNLAHNSISDIRKGERRANCVIRPNSLPTTFQEL